MPIILNRLKQQAFFGVPAVLHYHRARQQFDDENTGDGSLCSQVWANESLSQPVDLSGFSNDQTNTENRPLCSLSKEKSRTFRASGLCFEIEKSVYSPFFFFSASAAFSAALAALRSFLIRYISSSAAKIRSSGFMPQVHSARPMLAFTS